MTDEKAKETIASARRELAALGTIVDIMEPLDTDKRVRVLAAVLCLEFADVANAAVRHFQRGQR